MSQDEPELDSKLRMKGVGGGGAATTSRMSVGAAGVAAALGAAANVVRGDALRFLKGGGVGSAWLDAFVNLFTAARRGAVPPPAAPVLVSRASQSSQTAPAARRATSGERRVRAKGETDGVGRWNSYARPRSLAEGGETLEAREGSRKVSRVQ